MKKQVIMCLFSVFILNNNISYPQDKAELIKGVWNSAKLEKPDKIYFGNKEYWASVGSVYIFSDKGDALILQPPGRSFIVAKIDDNYPDVSLIIALGQYTNYQISGEDGRFVIHFIDKDHIWFEEMFPDKVFKGYISGAFLAYGKDQVYKRAGEVKQ